MSNVETNETPGIEKGEVKGSGTNPAKIPPNNREWIVLKL